LKIPYQFSGWFIPKALVTLFDEKILSSSDIILLSLIHSLMDPDRGCYASNDYLAKAIGYKDNKHIPRKLAKFKSLGLIKVTLSKNRQSRSIRTLWEKDLSKSKNGWPKDHSRLAKIPPVLPLIGEVDKKIDSRRNVSTEEVVEGKALGFGLLTLESKSDPIDEGFAKRLKSIVLGNSSRSPRINLINWAKEFRILRCKEEIDPNQIDQALTWLSIHFKDTYCPVILSAKSFRQKFEKILMAIEREERLKPPVKKIYSAKIQAQADSILESLNSLSWPKSSFSQLEDLVREACQVSQDLLRKFRSLQNQKDRTLSNRESLALQSAKRLLDSGSLITYFGGVHSKIARWKGWGGSMEPFRLVEDGKHLNLRTWISPPFEKYACSSLLKEVLELNDLK
jgi:hypothetical protein